MEPELVNALGLSALVAIGLRLGWIAHRRSVSRLTIHGGAASQFFNYLSATCFAAILPTVLMMVLVLHPKHVQLGGVVWHPLVLAVLALGVCSYAFSLLHAVLERGPMTRAQHRKAEREARGWTEEDARSSGL